MTEATVPSARGIVVKGTIPAHAAPILSTEALDFVAELHRRFDARRRDLLALRLARQARFDAGERLRFLDETRHLRTGDWKVAPCPDEIADRRVEITGPVDRKMVINALNSGANVFMADFEDSSCPTWTNGLEGQVNLRDAVRRTIEYTHPTTGKEYRLVDDPAVLFVRPRGWHLVERGLEVDGAPVSGGLFDLGLFLFHNAGELLTRGSRPYLYLPKLESHLEARLWNDVLVHAQEALAVPRGTVKATVLIETLPAAFEMDEILWELREHSAGLNCGRWDYIFSFVKVHREDSDALLPDRGTVGMDRHFLRSYSELLVRTCHRRGAFAMGGMAAQIPIKHDAAANEAALAKVRADKRREARAGHDGTWVAHPALVPIARAEFDAVLEGPNQLHVLREDVAVGADDLLEVPEGDVTARGLRQNLRVGLLYLEAWLRGVGCVPIDHLMEDAATAEISRAQVWQWVRHGAVLQDGRRVTPGLVRLVLEEELTKLHREVGSKAWAERRFELARELYERLILAADLAPFLTSVAYDHV